MHAGKVSLAVLLFLLATTVIQSNSSPTDTNDDDLVVISLTDDTFEKLTQASSSSSSSSPRWFVNFFAPWCGHCKSLAPKWEQLALKLAAAASSTSDDDKNEKVVIAKIDMTSNPLTRERFSIKGFPTLKYFPGDGRIYTYSGKRTVEDMMEYVRGGYLTAAKEGGKNSGERVPSPISKSSEKNSTNRKDAKTTGNVEDLKRRAGEIHPMLRDLVVDFEEIYHLRKNAAVVLIFVGAVWGWLSALCCVGCGRKGGSSLVITQKSKKD